MKKEELQRHARDLLNTHYYGSLSTIDGEGYPYGSLVRYCLDEAGAPLFSLSAIAEHTRNVLANPKVSLFVLDNKDDNIQEAARLSVYGEIEKLEDDADRIAHFSRFFPEAKQYHEELDFNFYRLNVERARYVGGFAKAHWLKDADFLQANPLQENERAAILGHMNDDHGDAVAHYCDSHNIDYANETPVLAGLDKEGFHVRIGKRIERIEFPSPVETRLQAREVFVAMVGGH